MPKGTFEFENLLRERSLSEQEEVCLIWKLNLNLLINLPHCVILFEKESEMIHDVILIRT